MTKTEAEQKMIDRRKRCARRRGSVSLVFTAPELAAVTVLAAAGRTQETIAKASGLSLASFKRAFDAHEDLRDSWLIGKSIRLEQRLGELEAQSKKGSTRATELLLRFEHRIAPPQTTAGRGDVTVNIGTLPPPQDPRSYAALVKRIEKQQSSIEHQPAAELEAPAPPLDPVAAVKEKQERGK